MDDLARFTESLREDLAAWQEATTGPPLNKHASQVAGIVSQLTEAMASLEVPGGQPHAELEQTIGDYLHIWDFFRSKLALRYVPWYQPVLAAADDLAWAAFQPVRDAAAHRMECEPLTDDDTQRLLRKLREPPLVYFSRDVIPFTVTRGQNYRNLLPRGGLWAERSEAIADNLVVPVVSLPWQRFSSLLVLLSVAHEVGHVVVTDLDLLPALRRRLANAGLSPAHLSRWSAWLEEVFADIFSAVVCGSSVALSLVDQLDRPAPADAEATPGPGRYPPVGLRARLILHVAERRSDLGDQPRPPRPRADQLTDFDEDVTAVAAALLDDGYAQIAGRLEDLYPPVDGAELRADISRLARGRDPEASDIRMVLAAATAVEAAKPAEYARQEAGPRALRRATVIRDVTRRRGDEGQLRARERDRLAGRALAALLAP